MNSILRALSGGRKVEIYTFATPAAGRSEDVFDVIYYQEAFMIYSDSIKGPLNASMISSKVANYSSCLGHRCRSGYFGWHRGGEQDPTHLVLVSMFLCYGMQLMPPTWTSITGKLFMLAFLGVCVGESSGSLRPTNVLVVRSGVVLVNVTSGHIN